MPIYEYACSACGHELEALQKLSDPKLVTCPECHRDTLAKKVSAAGFQLKGSGWYVTDFRNGGKAAAKSSDTAAKDKGDAAPSGESSSDKAAGGKDAPAKESAGKDTAAATPAPVAAKAEPAPAKPASTPSTGSST